MAFIEFLALVIIGLLIYLIWKLTKKSETLVQDEAQDDNLAGKLLLQQLQKIEKTMNDKSKEDNEHQKKVMKVVEETLGSFTRTIHGTKRRGQVGEALLKQILGESIKAGLVVTNLGTDHGTVEFAWDLKNGKYLPIDSKMPEIEELYKAFDVEDDPAKQLKLKKEMLKVAEKRKNEVKKYLNNRNTIDKCIVAIPDALFDQFPDMNHDSIRTGVYVAGYTKVFLFACVLGENYIKLMGSADVGVYREAISGIKNILTEIEIKSDTINKGITQITNANSAIKDEIGKSMTRIHQVSAIETDGRKKLK
ncbi:MAG: DNA recombination protein RmuC [Nanoarchaeota archaeon]|nr:DNA recombination protein RmuC [Nanoarchaeota archaeon]